MIACEQCRIVDKRSGNCVECGRYIPPEQIYTPPQIGRADAVFKELRYAVADSTFVASPPVSKRCGACDEVTTFVNAKPRECPACRSPYDAKLPDGHVVHCAICNLKAPSKPGMSPTFHGYAMNAVTDGWMRSFYPWDDKKMGNGMNLEQQWICPKDAAEIEKFKAHLKVPMLDEGDLL